MVQEENNIIAKVVPTIVMINGGFGGIHVVEGLRKTAVNIFLINNNNHHIFHPLLHQIATAEFEPAEIASPIRQMVLWCMPSTPKRSSLYQV